MCIYIITTVGNSVSSQLGNSCKSIRYSAEKAGGTARPSDAKSNLHSPPCWTSPLAFCLTGFVQCLWILKRTCCFRRRERKTKKKKWKCPKSKFIRICLKENFHREKKDWEKPFLGLKENVLNQNALGSFSRRTSTERRKTMKKLFSLKTQNRFLLVFLLSCYLLCKVCHLKTKKGFLGLSFLPERSHLGRSLLLLIWDIFTFFSLSIFSLCVSYTCWYVEQCIWEAYLLV